ncbi:MAG: dihydrodipicolinate synthase family protein [Burkholderiales bacterium]|nr:dihydrodipicolinate synthase family protein [Burkholderiales bacterium]
MKKTCAGIAGSPVTPFRHDNTIDFGTFEKQVDFLIAGGASALVHPMHIAESVSLSEEERRQLARALVCAAGGRVPAFVNVSYAGTDLSIEMARHAARCGASGVVLLAPYHRRAGPKALVDHFEAVADAAGGRLIAYSNAQASGTELTAAILGEMFDRIPGFVGIKDASLNMETFADICALIAARGRDIAALTASDLLLPSIAVGGDGCVSGCSEFAPRLVHALYRSCLDNDIPKARGLQRSVGRLLKVVRYNYPVAVKYAMELMGRPVGLPRRPLQPLTPQEKRWVKAELTATGVLDGEQRGW